MAHAAEAARGVLVEIERGNEIARGVWSSAVSATCVCFKAGGGNSSGGSSPSGVGHRLAQYLTTIRRRRRILFVFLHLSRRVFSSYKGAELPPGGCRDATESTPVSPKVVQHPSTCETRFQLADVQAPRQSPGITLCLRPSPQPNPHVPNTYLHWIVPTSCGRIQEHPNVRVQM